MAKKNSVPVTKRANRFYVYTGPAHLLAPATPEELQIALADMMKRQHVNVNIVRAEIAERETRTKQFPMLLIELMFLQNAPIGVNLRQYAAQHGVSREYSFAPDYLPGTK